MRNTHGPDGTKFDTASLIPLAFYIVPVIPGLIVDSITGDMWATYPGLRHDQLDLPGHGAAAGT